MEENLKFPYWIKEKNLEVDGELTDLTVSMYAFDAVSGDQTSFISEDDPCLILLGCLFWGL